MNKSVNSDYWKTDEGINLISQWKRNGCTNEEIANNIGINKATLYRWQQENATLRNALKITREIANTELENKAYQMALEGNTTMMIFLLKNRMSDRYRDRQEIGLDSSKEVVDAIKAMGSNLESR